LSPSYFIACICSLAKEIGFSDDVVQPFEKVHEIFVFSPFHGSLSKPLRDEQFELPNATVILFKDKVSGNYMIFTEGSLDLVLDLCSEAWDGAGLKPIDEPSKKKILDFHQNAIVNDGQCIAYAYGPVAPSEELTSILEAHSASSHIYFEVETAEQTPMNKRLMELISGQVFLCLGVLSHQPKEVIFYEIYTV
jgi:hypothetical protein